MHIYSCYKRWFLNQSPRLFGESFSSEFINSAVSWMMIASLYSMTDPVVFLCRCTHACVSLERAVATTSAHVIPWALWTLPIWLQNTTQHWDCSYPHPPGPLCSPHNILPSCIINHRLLTGTVLSCFQSNLSNRTQFVFVTMGDFSSTSDPVNHCVPQGSVLTYKSLNALAP